MKLKNKVFHKGISSVNVTTVNLQETVDLITLTEEIRKLHFLCIVILRTIS